MIKIPREGTKQVFKYQSYKYAHIPSPHLNVDISALQTPHEISKHVHVYDVDFINKIFHCHLKASAESERIPQ